MTRLPTPEVIELGNADLERPEPWEPWTGPKERPGLPGEEHKQDADAWPTWLTEERALWTCAVLAGIAAGLRLGGVS